MQTDFNKQNFYVADFETTTIEDNQGLYRKGIDLENLKDEETEVRLSCFKNLGDENKTDNYKIQTDIKDFLYHLSQDIERRKIKGDVYVFFHNLKFDGSFIINYLERNKISYETFISNEGIFYSITLNLNTNITIIFKDSLKILNFSIEIIGKNLTTDFNDNMLKGDTPLLTEKPTQIKPERESYIIRDVEILEKAIEEFYFNLGFEKFTSASETRKEFIDGLGDYKKYRNLYPTLNYKIDKELRECYNGGFTYVNPKFKNQEFKSKSGTPIINVYDVNSLYPSIMYEEYLPYGEPMIFDSSNCDNLDIEDNDNLNYKKFKNTPFILFIYKIQCNFKLKENHIPTLQIKNTVLADELDVKTSEYIESSKDMDITLTLTQYDLELLEKHYNLNIVHIFKVYKFSARNDIFKQHIDKYKAQKENAKSFFEKQKAKIMLNSLYGKFGARTENNEKITFLDNGKIKFLVQDKEISKGEYLPVAIFVTSIARYKIISYAQANYNDFIYSDTDSLHLFINKDNPVNLPLDPVKFGFFDLEQEVTRAKFLGAKLYIEEYLTDKGSKIKVTGAGITPEIKEKINFDNFKIGAEFKGKKTAIQAKGGILIGRTTFKIKERNGLVTR